MSRLSRALPGVAVLLVLALTGCGGDDESDADTSADTASQTATETAADEPTDEPTDGAPDAGSDISKDEFVSQANAICAAGNVEIEAAGAAVDPADPDSITTFATETLVPNVRGQLADIEALGYPSADFDALDAVFTEAGVVLDSIEADPTLLAGEADPFADVNTVLEGYGLTECAS